MIAQVFGLINAVASELNLRYQICCSETRVTNRTAACFHMLYCFYIPLEYYIPFRIFYTVRTGIIKSRLHRRDERNPACSFPKKPVLSIAGMKIIGLDLRVHFYWCYVCPCSAPDAAKPMTVCRREKLQEKPRVLSPLLPILFKNPGKTKVLKTDLTEIQHLKPALPMFPILAVREGCLLLLTREALPFWKQLLWKQLLWKQLLWKPLLWKQLLWRTLPLVIPLLHIR